MRNNGEGQPQSWDDSTPIGKMGLNARACNALRSAGRTTLGQIADMTVRELLAIPALGAGTAGHIINQAGELELAGRVEILEQQVRELRALAGLAGGGGGGVHDPDRGAEPGR
jgi:DNA-directed RNA polymerase alpha subunit